MIVVSGSLAYDDIVGTRYFGGTAGNIAYSLALLGERPRILASVGKDFGPYREHLEKLGVDLEHVRHIVDADTARFEIVTGPDERQVATMNLNAMAYPTTHIPSGYDALAIVSPGNLDDMGRLPRVYKRESMAYIFDPGQQISRLSEDSLKESLSGAHALMTNEEELAQFMTKTNWSLADIMERTAMVVTTYGGKGSRIMTPEGTLPIPPTHVASVRDVTGAGDGYRAGFLKGIVSGLGLERSGRLGSVMASFVVESDGPQGHRVSWKDLKDRYRQTYGEELE